MIRVHIILRDTAPQEPEVLRPLLEAAGVKQLEFKHLARFGLVSGLLPADMLTSVEALPFVMAVEEDSSVQAI